MSAACKKWISSFKGPWYPSISSKTTTPPPCVTVSRYSSDKFNKLLFFSGDPVIVNLSQPVMVFIFFQFSPKKLSSSPKSWAYILLSNKLNLGMFSINMGRHPPFVRDLIYEQALVSLSFNNPNFFLLFFKIKYPLIFPTIFSKNT